MKYYFKNKDREIHKKEEWKKAFRDADSRNHWKEGRSAECLAEDFIGSNPQGEKTINDMLYRFIHSNNISLNKAEIEHESKFDSYKSPRMQDLAIWGKIDEQNFFIGIEAKVDEPFGSKTIAEQRNSLNHTDADKRLDELVKNYLNGNEVKYGTLRYQLLCYLAGSFCEENADIIFMPVIVYKSRSEKYNLYDTKKGEINEKAYKQFMDSLGFEPMEQIIGGQIAYAYHKKVSALGKEKDVYSCYIIK